MKLALKIIAAIFIITGTGFYYLAQGMLENVKTRYLEGVEETLVDQSRILAGFVAHELEQESVSTDTLHLVFDKVYSRHFNSKIYQIEKNAVDLRVYITDTKGLILFDSKRIATPGEDYSDWRDVYLTLQGEYGARSTRENEKEESSAVLYVAAPIIVNGKIKGVLTVAKPTTNINSFLSHARSKIKNRIIITVCFIVFLSILIILYLTRPVKLLTTYANKIKNGKKASLPRLDKTEIGDMGRAFEEMRKALENRKYVENYVQTLTHEVKSPVSAIKGAAELLEEEMPKDQQKRFLNNIKSESDRIKMLVDRMLELSSIENMTSLKSTEIVSISELIQDITRQLSPLLEQKNLSLKTEISKELFITADSFLIRQAIVNLIQNSIDFSLSGDTICLFAAEQGPLFIVEVQDQGPGIPEYAEKKIFQKFFSLQRPDNGKKSTGLGLNFVKEITQLHEGAITLSNLSERGLSAKMSIPMKKGG